MNEKKYIEIEIPEEICKTLDKEVEKTPLFESIDDLALHILKQQLKKFK